MTKTSSIANLSKVIGTILRHDRKQSSYKIALLRSINDVVLGFPSLGDQATTIAVPLRTLAESWVAYYWPLTSPNDPILQGRVSAGKNDIAFRTAAVALHEEWNRLVGESRSSDGFFLVNDLRVARRRSLYPLSLLRAHNETVKRIIGVIQQPIRYAGPGEWTVFERPRRWVDIRTGVAIPGTSDKDWCVLINASLWRAFRDLSVWVEALCIHEWCLFAELVSGRSRGDIYTLLTDRPNNRRPLTWERNQIELLMMEGREFMCPWTAQELNQANYDLDHIVPIAVYPVNELWNLVPANRYFNQHVKRDRLPTLERLSAATPYLIDTYDHYFASPTLQNTLATEVKTRFSHFSTTTVHSTILAHLVASYVDVIAESRNIARF